LAGLPGIRRPTYCSARFQLKESSDLQDQFFGHKYLHTKPPLCQSKPKLSQHSTRNLLGTMSTSAQDQNRYPSDHSLACLISLMVQLTQVKSDGSLTVNDWALQFEKIPTTRCKKCNYHIISSIDSRDVGFDEIRLLGNGSQVHRGSLQSVQHLQFETALRDRCKRRVVMCVTVH
jgi:hypothetical protein